MHRHWINLTPSCWRNLLLTAAAPLIWGGKQTPNCLLYNMLGGSNCAAFTVWRTFEPCFMCWGPQVLDVGLSLVLIPKGLSAGKEYIGHRLSKGMAWACPAAQPRGALPEASGSQRARAPAQGQFRCSLPLTACTRSPSQHHRRFLCNVQYPTLELASK